MCREHPTAHAVRHRALHITRARRLDTGASDCDLDGGAIPSHITLMALSKKKATTIALDPEDDKLLTRAARERGVSRSEFIRQQLALVLEQYRPHPKPRSAGIIRSLSERGDEDELFGGRR